ncbi:TIGR02556 family CRISPR-associated protein [Chitinophaga oryziterrae]|uniref:TIGR02556 family CRISPR-associated protein n=1 Tax=Chitinophaga oryziterrae TaxID=1031224 RepID=A0A6N8JIX1_9BACT|nr:TIGR02556 family CRISPR-associated protein [Chitinophaga oryziterrae]MVT45187.1 TIGR02556 family CRISPR-associated protein [Chitinophaga oryziterrae]
MQDKAIVQIGKIALKEMDDKEPYELFIQNMFPDKDNYKMILPVFEIATGDDSCKCVYKNVDIQNVSTQNYLKYAYRKGSARGGDITFTTKFGDIEKKFPTLAGNQFKALISHFKDKSVEEFKILNAVYQFLLLKENYDRIKSDLSAVYDTIGKEDKNTSGLSLLFIINGAEKYLADFKIIQQIILNNGTEEKSEKYGVKSEGASATCSICFQSDKKVHGFASPFKYATVDKPGMVSGFFKQADNWKNYPICTDCSLEFELGRTYITNNLSSYFYGKAYYIIPKTLLSKDTTNLKKAVSRLKDLYKDISKTGEITGKEELLEKKIAEEEDYFNVNLLFYEENPTTKAIKIKLLLEEILPSRFKKLFVDAPKEINTNSLYKEAVSNKKVKSDLTFNLGVLKTFFEHDFYDLIHKVFTLQTFSTESLYGRFMAVIRSNYNRIQTGDYAESTRLTVLKAHLTLSYLKQLKLIDNHSNFTFMDTIEPQEKKASFDIEKLNRFIADNNSFLDTEYKIGIFSVGILVRLLLNIQNASLGNTPFEKKLKGYNLNSALLKSIYKEALSKISQYQGFYAYSNLREFIDQYFILNIEAINKLSNNELSFFFVAGIEFGSQFRNKEVKEETPTLN